MNPIGPAPGADSASAAAFAADLDRRLRAVADPGRAPAMQSYMKSAEPFLGVPAPLLRRTTAEAASAHRLRSAPARLEAATLLWDTAAHREHRYAAQRLTEVAACRGQLEFLPLYERMVSEGAWWDLVDGIHRNLADLLDAHPETMLPRVRAWATDADPWKRRAALVCQLSRKARTDVVLLAETIEANQDQPGFFLRKGIGWALREYAKTDPDWVRGFVAGHPGLSPLSRREALRRLPTPEPAVPIPVVPSPAVGFNA
ncbi:DNA alkylation repair protein [Arthrobacter ginkgonis]|uniref:DNA alkylation repair protein n=1 Tax=Arthrobacter ginkgonis TaxID=1630594 RepID=A0ABP7CGU6_9MICC